MRERDGDEREKAREEKWYGRTIIIKITNTPIMGWLLHLTAIIRRIVMIFPLL